VPVDVDQRDRCGQHAHADGGRHAVIRGKPGGDNAVDMGCQNIDPSRHADDGRNGEGGEAPDDHQREGGQDRRPQDRQRDPPQRAQVRRPADFRGFLQGDVECGHGRGDDQVGDRQIQQPLHEDHPRQRVDVEERPLNVEQLLQIEIDQAVRGVQEEDPADREQDVGDHHRDDGDDPEQKLEGDVGPRVQVGEEQREKRRDDGGAEREDGRVDENVGEGRVRVRLDVLLQREGSERVQARTETPEEEHEDGADREESHDRDEARRQNRPSASHRSFPAHRESTEQWSGSKIRETSSLSFAPTVGSTFMTRSASPMRISPS